MATFDICSCFRYCPQFTYVFGSHAHRLGQLLPSGRLHATSGYTHWNEKTQENVTRKTEMKFQTSWLSHIATMRHALG
jgi:hypothetical protein